MGIVLSFFNLCLSNEFDFYLRVSQNFIIFVLNLSRCRDEQRKSRFTPETQYEPEYKLTPFAANWKFSKPLAILNGASMI